MTPKHYSAEVQKSIVKCIEFCSVLLLRHCWEKAGAPQACVSSYCLSLTCDRGKVRMAKNNLTGARQRQKITWLKRPAICAHWEKLQSLLRKEKWATLPTVHHTAKKKKSLTICQTKAWLKPDGGVLPDWGGNTFCRTYSLFHFISPFRMIYFSPSHMFGFCSPAGVTCEAVDESVSHYIFP